MRELFIKIGKKFFLSSGNSLSINFGDNTDTIKEVLKYKALNNNKLSPSDRHLLRNLDRINKRLFAPTYKSVAINIFFAFFRPIIILTMLFQLTLGIKNKFYKEESIEEVVATHAVKIEDDRLLDLAQYITPDQQKSVSVNNNYPILYTSFNSPAKQQTNIVEEIKKEDKVDVARIEPKPSNKESLELIRQQNLVKFISGLIAAFRPTLHEPGEIARNIVELSSAEDFNPFYLAAIISIESRFISNAESNVGALGLMQIMPATAREVVRKNYSSRSNITLTHPRTNIKLGIDYLKFLEEKFRGNKSLILAAYNWGPANVDSAKRNFRNIPTSVQKYATTILKRSVLWQNHFTKANQIADSLTIETKNN